MATNDHGKCPHCDADLNGGFIWEHFYLQFTEGTGYWKDEDGNYSSTPRLLTNEQVIAAADNVAEKYGASRGHGQWGRAIGIYDMEKDRTVRWQCPDCNGEWLR